MTSAVQRNKLILDISWPSLQTRVRSVISLGAIRSQARVTSTRVHVIASAETKLSDVLIVLMDSNLVFVLVVLSSHRLVGHMSSASAT